MGCNLFVYLCGRVSESALSLSACFQLILLPQCRLALCARSVWSRRGWTLRLPFSSILFAHLVEVSATLFKQQFRALAHFALPEWFGLLDGKCLAWRSGDTLRQASSYMVISATENDQLVGKRNASRTPLRPSQASTLVSPTGKSVPKARRYSTTSTSAGPTYPCHECVRVLQARIGMISHLHTHRVVQQY